MQMESSREIMLTNEVTEIMPVNQKRRSKEVVVKNEHRNEDGSVGDPQSSLTKRKTLHPTEQSEEAEAADLDDFETMPKRARHTRMTRTTAGCTSIADQAHNQPIGLTEDCRIDDQEAIERLPATGPSIPETTQDFLKGLDLEQYIVGMRRTSQDLSRLSTTMVRIGQGFDLWAAREEEYKDLIENLELEVNGLDSQVKGLEGEVKGLKGEVDGLKGQLRAYSYLDAHMKRRDRRSINQRPGRELSGTQEAFDDAEGPIRPITRPETSTNRHRDFTTRPQVQPRPESYTSMYPQIRLKLPSKPRKAPTHKPVQSCDQKDDQIDNGRSVPHSK